MTQVNYAIIFLLCEIRDNVVYVDLHHDLLFALLSNLLSAQLLDILPDVLVVVYSLL